MFKSIGVITSSLAMGENLPLELSEVISESRQKARENMIVPAIMENKDLLAAIRLCESPIEKIMLVAMIHMPSKIPAVIHDAMSGEPFPQGDVVITPQFVISRYRLDFLVTIRRPIGVFSFAVECDGIEFHGGPEARKQDRERDIYLRSLGIKTVRYYGQKIKQLRHKCADEIAAIINEELARE